MKSSHVPHRSLNQSHATFMPDTAQAVSRFPLSLSWCRDSHQFWRRPIVFDTSSDGLLALVSLIHSWSRLAGPFPQRSPPWLLTTAAWGALKPAPESRLRGAFPHLLCSLVAHYLQHIITFESLQKVVIFASFHNISHYHFMTDLRFDGWNFKSWTPLTLFGGSIFSQQTVINISVFNSFSLGLLLIQKIN